MSDSPLLPAIQVTRNSSGGIRILQVGSSEPFDISKYEGVTFITQEEHRRALKDASTLHLTGAMIAELAAFAGFAIDISSSEGMSPEEIEEDHALLDDEFIICPGPPQGVRMGDGSVQFFPLIAIAVNGDDGEVTPLGDPIPQT